MNLRRLIPYLILTTGIVVALLLGANAASTAKELQQTRFEDQQALNARLKQVAKEQKVINQTVAGIDKRQDALGCTLESLQRRHPGLFDDAVGPMENSQCAIVRKEGPSNTEPSLE